jgi:hypothetical protein
MILARIQTKEGKLIKKFFFFYLIHFSKTNNRKSNWISIQQKRRYYPKFILFSTFSHLKKKTKIEAMRFQIQEINNWEE